MIVAKTGTATFEGKSSKALTLKSTDKTLQVMLAIVRIRVHVATTRAMESVAVFITRETVTTMVEITTVAVVMQQVAVTAKKVAAVEVLVIVVMVIAAVKMEI